MLQTVGGGWTPTALGFLQMVKVCGLPLVDLPDLQLQRFQSGLDEEAGGANQEPWPRTLSCLVGRSIAFPIASSLAEAERLLDKISRRRQGPIHLTMHVDKAFSPSACKIAQKNIVLLPPCWCYDPAIRTRSHLTKKFWPRHPPRPPNGASWNLASKCYLLAQGNLPTTAGLKVTAVRVCIEQL